MAFQVWDYVVFILMLSVSAGIGIYYRLTGGKQKTAEVSEFYYEIALSFIMCCWWSGSASSGKRLENFPSNFKVKSVNSKGY